MTQDKKQFLKKFFIAFGISFAVLLFVVFVLMRGMFCNAFIAKGEKSFNKADYDSAIEYFETAKSWKKKSQLAYLSLAKAYIAKEDYDTAGKLIDEAIQKKITTKEAGIEQLHIMRVKVYSASGKLADAVNYIDTLPDQYMRKKIQDARPENISYSPMQGSYDSMLKMTITVKEGETVYYTTDGSYPTKFSNMYTSPINIGNGTTKINAISVNSDGLVSPLLNITYEVTNDNEPVTFDDPKIEQMVRNALYKPRGVVLVKELASITTLTNEDADGLVRTLSDLDLMPNLEVLYLHGESNMMSISQLSGKSKLRELGLANCELDSEDINALGGLAALEDLDISGNKVSTISALSELTALRNVYLDGNRVSDLSPLSKSQNIETISAKGNTITAIPDFETAQQLKTLILANNRIDDLSTIHRLTALTYLDLSSNNIKNAKNLSALTNLDTLVLADNPITNFDFVKDFRRLTVLDVNSTDFISLSPLENLPLTTLDASNTGLASLSGIETLSKLTYLSIADTDVTDISLMPELKKLGYLDISYLKLKDPAPLFTMKELSTLVAAGHDFKGIAFANPDITVIYE